MILTFINCIVYLRLNLNIEYPIKLGDIFTISSKFELESLTKLENTFISSALGLIWNGKGRV